MPDVERFQMAELTLDQRNDPQILKRLADSDSIQKGSIIAIESPKKMEFEFQNSLVLMVRKTYGGTALDLLEKQ